MKEHLRQKILAQFELGQNSIHGISHWLRVEKMGLALADKTGADRNVVSLFAYLHDSKRRNEFMDPDHGSKAADFVNELCKSREITASEKQLKQLLCACRCHSDPNAKSDDITVMTCWDADRLDLWRVGETPDPKWLNTDAAKDPEMIRCSKL